MSSFELRPPLHAHLGPYDHYGYRAAFEALQNPQIGLQGKLRSAAEYRGGSSRTAGHKAIEPSSAGNGPRKRPDRSDSPRLSSEAAKLRPSGARSQVDVDLQAALDSVFPPADQEALDKFSISSFETLVRQL